MSEILTESFCERCGTRYTFEAALPTVRLKRVKVLSRGLKNFVMSDDTTMDEAMTAARNETDRGVTTHQLDAFHQTFNFCMSCRQYTCANCWNEAEARCLSCAPHLGQEIMPAPFPDLNITTGLGLVTEPFGMNAVFDTNGANGTNGAAATNGATAPDGAMEQVAPEKIRAEVGPVDIITELNSSARRERMIPSTAAPAVPQVEAEPTAEPIAVEAEAPIEAIAPVEAETFEPVEITAPVEAEEQFEAEPVVEAEAFEPVVEAEAPVEITAPVEIEAPVEAFEPVEAEAPVEVFAPAEITAPVEAEAQVEVEEPVEALVFAPVEAEAPVEAVAPVDGSAFMVHDDQFDLAARLAGLGHPAPGIDAVQPDDTEASAAASLHEKTVAQTAGWLKRFRMDHIAEPDIDASRHDRVEADAAVVADAATEAEVRAPEAVIEDAPVEPAPIAMEPTEMLVEPEAPSSPLPEDVVPQPTWRLVAPHSGEAAALPYSGDEPPLPKPADPTPNIPVAASAADVEPQWPTRPEWLGGLPASGLPFLGRPATPLGGLEALWAESNREVVATPVATGRPSGVQPCISCGLSLSAKARFCRRCGTVQVG